MSYTYRKDSFGDEDQKFHLLMTPFNQYAGRFTIPLVTGAFSVTGVGFQPDAVIIIGGQGEAIRSTSGNYAGRLSLGCATSSSSDNQWALGVAGGYLTNPAQRVKSWRPGYIISACDRLGTEPLRASLTSMDSDGFTLNFDLVGPWRGYPMTELFFLCLQGNYHAGVHELGSDITGAPFPPKGIWAVSARETESILTAGKGYQVAQGFGSRDGQVCWTGAGRDLLTESPQGPRSTGYWDTEHLMTLIQPSDGPFYDPSGPDVSIIGQATLNSFTGDGVSLFWDLVDGVKQHHQVGHLLVGTDAEAGTFVYPANSTDDSPYVGYRDVTTRLVPTAMLSGAFGPISSTPKPVGFENFNPGAIINFGFGAEPAGGWLDRGDPRPSEEFFATFAESTSSLGFGFQLTNSMQGDYWQMGTWSHVNEPAGLIEQRINVIAGTPPQFIVGTNWRVQGDRRAGGVSRLNTK